MAVWQLPLYLNPQQSYFFGFWWPPGAWHHLQYVQARPKQEYTDGGVDRVETSRITISHTAIRRPGGGGGSGHGPPAVRHEWTYGVWIRNLSSKPLNIWVEGVELQ